MKSHSSSLMQEIAGVGGWSGGRLENGAGNAGKKLIWTTLSLSCVTWSQFQVKMKVLSHRDQNHTGSHKWVGLWLLDY